MLQLFHTIYNVLGMMRRTYRSEQYFVPVLVAKCTILLSSCLCSILPEIKTQEIMLFDDNIKNENKLYFYNVNNFSLLFKQIHVHIKDLYLPLPILTSSPTHLWYFQID